MVEVRRQRVESRKYKLEQILKGGRVTDERITLTTIKLIIKPWP